jgi:signal transduction histidine kinase
MLRFFQYRLNFKIFFSFMLIIFITTISALLIGYLIIRNTIDREIRIRLADSITAYSQEVQFIEQQCLKIAEELSSDRTLVTLLAEGRFNPLENQLVHYHRLGIFDIIEIEDTSGKVILRGHQPEAAGDVKINQEIVKEGLAGRSAVSYEQGQSGVAIRAVSPIKSNGEILGVLMIGSLFSADFAEHIKLLTGMENGIYQGYGKVVSTYRGYDHLPEEVVSRLTSDQTVFLRNVQLNQESSYFMLKPLFLKESSYWGALSLGVSQQEEKRYLRYSQNLLYLMIVIGVLLAFVIYVFLARNINTSLVKILAGMDGLNIDRFDTRIELASKDEFGLISESFNRLVRKLSLYSQRIQKLQDDMIKSAKLATAGQMAAGLAHEIRNPLSSIKMMAQILRERYLKGAEGQSEIITILAESERLNDLIKDMLEFARPSPMRFARHNSGQIVEEILNLFRYNTEHQNIKVIARLDGSIPPLFLDREKFRLVVMNLVLNAVQAMPQGGTLEVTTERRRDDGVVFCFCDDGQEIAPENLGMIFEPFFTTKKEGTGLGLAIVKMIVERHFGKVEVRSSKARTCFSITIPEDLEQRIHTL